MINEGKDIIANIKFTNTPEILTRKVSLFTLEKLNALIGTGFAHPKPKNKKHNKPVVSKWAIGFKVNLPAFFAVGSPNLFAVNACANSCEVNATITATV